MPKGEKCPKYVSGNSLKGLNVKKKKKKEISMRQGKRPDAGGDEKLHCKLKRAKTTPNSVSALLGPKLFWPYVKAILALESWIGTHGAILGMEESQIGPTLCRNGPIIFQFSPINCQYGPTDQNDSHVRVCFGPT